MRQSAEKTFASIRAKAADMLGIPLVGTVTLAKAEARKPAPRLSESWFCCAEPTAG